MGSDGFVPRVKVGFMERERVGKRNKHSMLEAMHPLGEVMDMEGRRNLHQKQIKRRR